MSRIIKKFRKIRNTNNQGFSLIEVLVAMVILALLSFPILSSFGNSARLNHMARQEENANAVAGDMIEEYKMSSLSDLKNKYTYTTDVNGAFQFDEVTRTGNNGESYQVQVTLDPQAYQNGDSLKDINSYDTPSYSSLNNDRNIVIMDMVYMYDQQALEHFKTSNKAGISKKLELTVSVVADPTDKTVFTEVVDGVVTYTKTGAAPYSAEFHTKGYTLFAQSIGESKYRLSNEEKLRAVYLFYTPYVAATDGSSASDSISIKYNYPVERTDVQVENCEVYLVEQKNDGLKSLNRSNISISVNNGDAYNESKLLLSGTVDLSKSPGTAGPVSVYANVKEWDKFQTGTKRNNGLTQNHLVSGDGKLYTMTVTVKKDGKSITSVSTTKGNMS